MFSQNTTATGDPLNAVTSNGSVPIRFFPVNVGVVPISRRGSKSERDFGASQELDAALFGEHVSAARAAVGVVNIAVDMRATASVRSGQRIRAREFRLRRPVCGKENPISVGAPATARSSARVEHSDELLGKGAHEPPPSRVTRTHWVRRRVWG